MAIPGGALSGHILASASRTWPFFCFMVETAVMLLLVYQQVAHCSSYSVGSVTLVRVFLQSHKRTSLKS